MRHHLALCCLFAFFARAEAEEMDLPGAIERAGAHSAAARASHSVAREAEEREAQAWGAMSPRVDLDATQAWLSSDVNDLVGKSLGTQKAPDRVSSLGVSVTQPLVALAPLFLKTRMEIAGARQARIEARQSTRLARFSGAESFLRAFKAGELLRIAQASLRLAEKQKVDGEALARIGKLKPIDLLRLDLAIAEGKTQLSQAETVRNVALFALAETTGVKEFKDLTLKTPQRTLFQEKTSTLANPEALLAEALGDRSEVTGAATRLEIARLAARAAWWDLAPAVNLFARFERDFAKGDVTVPPSMALDPLTRMPSVTAGKRYAANDIRDNFSFGLNLRWNLWDGNARWNRQQEMAAREETAMAQSSGIETGVRLEVMQAWLELQSARDSVTTAKTTLKFAEEVYRQQNSRFQLGMATVTDITSAERDQTRALAGLATSETDLELAALKLLKALGKEPL